MFKTFLILAFTPATLLVAGKFNCGMLNNSSDQVTLQIPRPPDAYPQVKSIKVEIAEADRNFHDQIRLKAQIEQALGKDFNVDSPKPDARLRVTVVAYDAPTLNTRVQMESRPVTVGNKVQTQNVPVTYWIGSGRISLRVQLVDNDGVPMDSFDPEEVYRVTREAVIQATGPQQKSSTDWLHTPTLGFPGKKPSPKPEQGAGVTGKELTPAEINAAMLDEVSAKIRRRYVRSIDNATFKLACDDALRSGNRMAVGSSPEWEKATKLWSDAELGRNDADKDYNLAVAQEALAYKAYDATLNPADALPFFEKALSLYDKAQQLDPGEKYISTSAERLKTARADIARAVDQRKLWEAERDRARNAFIEKREGQKAMTAQREDSPKEASFRRLVRAKLATDPKAETKSVEALGERLTLKEMEINRVLTQETNRLKNLIDYDAMFVSMVSAGSLGKEDRNALNIYAQGLNLSEADRKSVESKHPFREEGVPAPQDKTLQQAPNKPVPPTIRKSTGAAPSSAKVK